MKAGDLVVYGEWFNGAKRVGILLEPGAWNESWLVMWADDHEAEWEFENELEVINESR